MKYFHGLALSVGQVELPWGQVVETSDLAIVLLLVLLEGILSIDNALVLGLLAKRLPPHQRSRALAYGLIGAFVFRFVAIATATFLLKWTFAKFLGGAYLMFIAVKHLVFEFKELELEEAVVDQQGGLELVDARTGQPLSAERERLEIKARVPIDIEVDDVAEKSNRSAFKTGPRKFWWTVLVIELTDIAFAVDSILAAIGIVGAAPKGMPTDAFHPKLWVIILGGFLGLIVMRFAAFLFIRLLERFPRFETAAYLLVLIIGMKLVLDWGFNSDWSEYGWQANQRWAESYVHWIQTNWPLKLGKESLSHPHLLDFHDIRRPESLLFWMSMLLAFCVGFLRQKQPNPPA